MVVDESPNTDQMRSWSDTLSAAWERHRDFLFQSQRPVSEWLVDQIAASSGDVVLELAAGPGETGFLVAERLGSEGRLISTDLGEGMVAAARRGAAARELDNVEARVMDAQAIDLADASVDAVLCRFGVMLMPEPNLAVAGVRRVLRSGGRFAYAVWAPPDRNPWLTMLAMAVMQSGHQPPGSPFDAGGPFSLADPAANEQLLSDAGLELAAQAEVVGVMRFDDFAGYWDLQTQVSGPLALFISNLDEPETQAIRAALEPMLEPFRSGSGYELPTAAMCFAASSP